MLAEFELTIYFHISFTSENEQRVATIKKNWLNLDEVFITTFFSILKNDKE